MSGIHRDRGSKLGLDAVVNRFKANFTKVYDCIIKSNFFLTKYFLYCFSLPIAFVH